MDIRRIDLTPRSLMRAPWYSIGHRARRALIVLVLLAPIMGIAVLFFQSPQSGRASAIASDRTAFLAPLSKAIRAAAEHPNLVNTAVQTAPPSQGSQAPVTTTPPVVTTTEPPQAPAPVPAEADVDTSSAAAWAASPGVACIREHESGDDYGANTGNGYYGAYQDLLSTWQAAGGTGLPSDAPPAVQDKINYQIWLSGGWGQWGTAAMCGL